MALVDFAAFTKKVIDAVEGKLSNREVGILKRLFTRVKKRNTILAAGLLSALKVGGASRDDTDRLSKILEIANERIIGGEKPFKEAEKRRQQDVRNLSDRIESARVEAKNYTDQEVQAVWDEMARKAENEKSFAEDALAALEYSFAEMENLQCTKYKPGKYRDYQNHIADVKNNIGNELFNPAIATAQSAYRESFTIRDNLEELSNKGIELSAAYEEKKAMLKELIDSQKLVTKEYETTDHAHEKVEIDLSFWASEEWYALVSSFEAMENRHTEVAQTNGDNYLKGLEELNNHSEKLIEDYFILKNEGLNRHFASVATMDRQEDIYRSLSNSGFEVVDNFFENEDEEESKEKEKKIDEKVVLAKFYLERKKSRVNSFELLKEILNSEKENNFTTRKAMFQAAKLYGELGMSHIQKTIEMDLIEGKWGKCEKQILDKLNEEDKKDLWDKTKELFKNKKKIPLKKSSQILFSKC